MELVFDWWMIYTVVDDTSLYYFGQERSFLRGDCLSMLSEGYVGNASSFTEDILWETRYGVGELEEH